ncbi:MULTISPECIES: rod shape-determining protein MreD [Pseudidiomarina]|uniref:Rod shape-determining protein MreD n=3 Tax=Pseudidiomarina TaxID=2800384 RepID=A0A368UXG4_9GAMM|nr:MULTISPECIES: rod shape-determining protein MreD [Pseudidiomarina]PWW13058.1 rod shape-determining protein MreD [Pseudidiomarina maritima]RBP90408.1 rod shape-determining protein MreD [Pseudidiomarina tainanensis]RCW32084.1 rod shape-determining protein MreD [Pseudidiomarina tainanensis]
MWIKAGLLPLFITYIIGLVLMVMPMPLFLEAWRPDWLSLVIIYWLMALPHRVGMGTVLILGLMTDILMGSIFGIYASALLVMAYAPIRHFQRFRNYSLTQQALVVAVLILVKRVLVYQLEHWLNDAVFHVSYLYPVISSAIAWPWVYLILRKYRRHYGIQ